MGQTLTGLKFGNVLPAARRPEWLLAHSGGNKMRLSEQREFARFCLMILIIIFFVNTAYSKSVIDPKVDFDFEMQKENEVSVCHLIILLITYPDPEGVNLKIIGTSDKKLGNARTIYYGFSVDVGETPISHGLPQPIVKKPISSAAILADVYSSKTATRPANPGDGGFMAVADSPSDAQRLLSLIMRRDYMITFKRLDMPDDTVYAVHPAPPAAIAQKFLDCAKNL